MAMTDPVANMLATIRNGQRAKLAVVHYLPSSSEKKNVLDVLQREGYIRAYSEEDVRKGIKQLKIELKYSEGKPVIRNIKRISKPGNRVYASVTKFPKVYNGLGISILSTSKGVMSDHEARIANVGGEVLCSVF